MNDDELSELGSRPPPRKEDILFPRRSSEVQNAYVDITQGMVDWVYSNGFRLAARNLTKLVSDASNEQVFLIYPIVYLYRHHAELVLKDIIKSSAGLLDRELAEQNLKALGNHSLRELWQAARPLLNLVCERASAPPFPAVELEGVDSYIDQIHEHDPDGQRFRYGTTKAKGANRSGVTAPSLSPDLKLANVETIAIAMERLAEYLEGIEGWFVELEDAKAELRRKLNVAEGGE